MLFGYQISHFDHFDCGWPTNVSCDGLENLVVQDSLVARAVVDRKRIKLAVVEQSHQRLFCRSEDFSVTNVDPVVVADIQAAKRSASSNNTRTKFERNLI